MLTDRQRAVHMRMIALKGKDAMGNEERLGGGTFSQEKAIEDGIARWEDEGGAVYEIEMEKAIARVDLYLNSKIQPAGH